MVALFYTTYALGTVAFIGLAVRYFSAGCNTQWFDSVGLLLQVTCPY